jgi:hypothetical protein
MVVQPARRAAVGSMLNWPILASSVAYVGVLRFPSIQGVANPPAKPVKPRGLLRIARSRLGHDAKRGGEPLVSLSRTGRDAGVCKLLF